MSSPNEMFKCWDHYYSLMFYNNNRKHLPLTHSFDERLKTMKINIVEEQTIEENNVSIMKAKNDLLNCLREQI